jgi:hypothetical protein
MSRAGLEPAILVFEHLGITICFMFILANFVTKCKHYNPENGGSVLIQNDDVTKL